MQKSKRIKIGALLGGAMLVIAGVVLVVSHFLKQEDVYRSILVYELEGTAEIEREKTGSIRATENIYLESGDRLKVDGGSYIRLKLDDDKYIMVEENSVLSIEAVGDEKDSKTKIQLEKGAVTSEIQNPLSADSEYEVTSPNSVMAVRGTIFRVETDIEQGNVPRTKTSVFSGKVAMGVRHEDGTAGEEILVSAGEEGVGEGNRPISTQKINYSEFSPQAIGILQDLLEQGAALEGFTKNNSEELGDKMDSDSIENKPEDGDNQNSASDGTGNEDSLENNQTSSAPNETNAGETGNVAGSKPDIGNTNPSDKVSSDNTTDKETGSQPDGETSETKPDDNKKPDGDKSETKPDDNKKPDGDKSETKPDDNKKPDDDKTETKPDDNNKPDDDKVEYKVTFEYQGKVFATQTVISGQCAKKPTLMPAPFGAWDFDFSTKVTKDITITWK